MISDPFFLLGPWRFETSDSVTLPLPPGANPVPLDVVSAEVLRWAGGDDPAGSTLRIGMTSPDLIAETSEIVEVGFSLERALYRGRPDRGLDVRVPDLTNCTDDPDPYCAPKTIRLSYRDVEAVNEACPACVPDVVFVGPTDAALSEVPWVIADERRVCYGKPGYKDRDDTLAEIMGLPAEYDDDPLTADAWAPFRDTCAKRAEFDAKLDELDELDAEGS